MSAGPGEPHEVYLVQLVGNELLSLRELLLWALGEPTAGWTADETARRATAEHVLQHVRAAQDRVRQYPMRGQDGRTP